MRNAFIRDPATLTCSLVPLSPSPRPTELSATLILSWQPLEMELPLSSPARCELLSVLHFLCAKNTVLVDIHSQLCEAYRKKCMSVQHVHKWY